MESRVLKTRMNFVGIDTCTDFVDFNNASFRISSNDCLSNEKAALLSSLLYQPTIFQRKDVRWIAAYTWKADAKERGVSALKVVKNGLDPVFIREAAEPVAALIRQLFGAEPADAVTCVPCGHSRRPDCFGKRFAQSVAETLSLPFVQVFADQPRIGTSHPRHSARLPQLRQIAKPAWSTIVIDDLATSGGHLEQTVLALRQLGVTAPAMAWISGSRVGGTALGNDSVGRETKRDHSVRHKESPETCTATRDRVKMPRAPQKL